MSASEGFENAGEFLRFSGIKQSLFNEEAFERLHPQRRLRWEMAVQLAMYRAEPAVRPYVTMLWRINLALSVSSA
jgi:hypothetical protein